MKTLLARLQEEYQTPLFTPKEIFQTPMFSAADMINFAIAIQQEQQKVIANIEDIVIENIDEFGDECTVIGTAKSSILNENNIIR